MAADVPSTFDFFAAGIGALGAARQKLPPEAVLLIDAGTDTAAGREHADNPFCGTRSHAHFVWSCCAADVDGDPRDISASQDQGYWA